MTSPCPACGAELTLPLPGWSPRCSGCRAGLRSPRMAVVYSLALPGTGHLYLGRRAFGITELLVAMILVGLGIRDVILATVHVSRGELPITEILWTVAGWAPWLVGYSILSGALTWVVSKNVCRLNKKEE